eukprot:894358-Prymnesium_polylepis.1
MAFGSSLARAGRKVEPGEHRHACLHLTPCGPESGGSRGAGRRGGGAAVRLGALVARGRNATPPSTVFGDHNVR